MAATVRFWRAWLGRARIPDHRWRDPDPAVGARDQGPDVHADRGDGRGAHDVAARDAGRRAQLGLPLHLDAGHDVHAPGAALPEPRLGGRRVHAVRRGHRGKPRRLAADHVRDRRPPRPDRVDAGRPLGLRRRPPGPHRQRGLRPAAERRLRRRARLVPPPHPQEPAAPAATVADRPGAGEVRHGGLAEPGPGHLGGTRQAAALRVLEAHGLGRPRPRGEARRDHEALPSSRRSGPRPRRRSARTSSRTASASGASSGSTTRRTPSTPRRSWLRSSASSPATTIASASRCSRSPTS